MEIRHKKNTAKYLAIPMLDVASPETFLTGETVSDEAFFKDGAGAWTSLAISDTFSEIGTTGIYEIDLSASEMNHDQVIIKITSSGSADNFVLFQMFDVDIDDLPTAAGIADAVWDEAISDHNTIGSFGQRFQIVRANTAQGGSFTTVKLDAGASGTTDFYNGCFIKITSGPASDQRPQAITSYNEVTKDAVVSPGFKGTSPTSSSEFVIYEVAGHWPVHGTDVNLVTILQDNDAPSALLLFGDTMRGRFVVDASPAPTTTTFATTSSNASLVTGFYNGQMLVFTTGSFVGLGRKIVDYTVSGTTRTFTVEDPYLVAPSAGDECFVVADVAQSAADINSEVSDVLKTDVITQPGQETPAANQTIDQMVAYLYKAWRNKKDQSASLYQLYNDDASTIDQKATLAEAGGTVTAGEVSTGP